MRILFINYCYDNYWQQLYAKNTDLGAQPYADQVKAVYDDFFMFYGVYSYHLRQHGYECEEFFYNVRPQQVKWAQENGIAWDENGYKQINALEKVRQFKPDLIFLVSMEHDRAWMDQARSVCPTLRHFVRWCAVSVPMDTLRGYDLVLTSTRGLEQVMRDHDVPVERIPFGFNVRVLDAVPSSLDKVYPLSFVGSIHFSKGYHLDRTNILAGLLQRDLLKPFAQVDSVSRKRQLYLQVMRAAWQCATSVGCDARLIEKLPLVGRHLALGGDMDLALFRKVAYATLGPRYGLEMYKTVARSYATFNVHVDAAGEYVGNIRMYEATGVGTCLLTDWKKDLAEFFDTDTEVIAYYNLDDAIEKATWLVNNPQQCLEIGRAAQKRVFRDHTYQHRAALMHQIFTDRLFR